MGFGGAVLRRWWMGSVLVMLTRGPRRGIEMLDNERSGGEGGGLEGRRSGSWWVV